MAPRESAQTTAQSYLLPPSTQPTPSLSGEVSTHGPRGKKGYCRNETGLLDVTPLSDEEVEIYNRNARECPILQLPAEVRNMIWKYAVGGHTVTQSPINKTLQFNILGTCRQIYAEAAMFPFTENILREHCALMFNNTLRASPLLGLFRRMRLEIFGVGSGDIVRAIVGRLPRSSFRSIAAIDFVLHYLVSANAEDLKPSVEVVLRECFPDEKLTFRHVSVKLPWN